MFNKKYITILAIVLAVLIFFGIKSFNKSSNNQAPEKTKTSENTNLTIVSTNPSPLDQATISPIQPIEITFSQPISKSDFKYQLAPAMEHEVTSIGGQSSDFGQTFRITFKKPLELGAAFTLSIQSDTKVNDKTRLDKEYIFHVKTIGYKGV